MRSASRSASRSTSHSAELLKRTKYAAAVAIKSLMEREGEEESRMRRKNGNYRLTKRFGADDRGNNHADHKIAASDRGLLERAEKRRQVDSASVSDICRSVVVSCGVHCGGGGGDFVKNRYG